MDNVCHTAVGGMLAATGLRRVTPGATAALLIGSNLPDVEALWVWPGDQTAFLEMHRGWTHSLIGVPILAVALAGVLVWWTRRLGGERGAGRFGALYGISLLAAGLHLFLDYTNAYGVRLFLPFDDRWFYGDALFIVDPWMWGLPLLAVHVVGPKSLALRILLWGLWGAITFLLWWLDHLVPRATAVAFLALPLLALLRDLGILRLRRPEWVAVALAALVTLYVAGAFVVHHAAQRAFRASWERITSRWGSAELLNLAVLPTPAHPLRFHALLRLRETGESPPLPLRPEPGEVPRHVEWVYSAELVYTGAIELARLSVYRQDLRSPRVRSFLETSAGRTVLEFFRFPVARLEEVNGERRLVIRDLRFGETGSSRVGRAVVP